MIWALNTEVRIFFGMQCSANLDLCLTMKPEPTIDNDVNH